MSQNQKVDDVTDELAQEFARHLRSDQDKKELKRHFGRRFRLRLSSNGRGSWVAGKGLRPPPLHGDAQDRIHEKRAAGDHGNSNGVHADRGHHFRPAIAGEVPDSEED